MVGAILIMSKLVHRLIIHREYHSNWWNLAIHYFTIPTLVFTLFGALHSLHRHLPYLGFDGVLILVSVYPYCTLDCLAGLLTTLWFVGLMFLARLLYWTAESNGKEVVVIAGFVTGHFAAWAIQMLGHHLCEKRNAKFDVPQLLTTPLLETVEFLHLFGYKDPEYKQVADGLENRLIYQEE